MVEEKRPSLVAVDRVTIRVASNTVNAIVETNGTSKRFYEGPFVNPPERGGDVDLRYRMVAPCKGPFPNFQEAFTQLHLGQLLALVKCFIRDRRDGGIDPKADHMLRDNVSDRPHVDENLGIIGGIAGHG